jgi:hypothetical protein
MKTCSLITAAVLACCALPTLALAQGAEHNGTHDVQVWLDGYQEVPAVSTTGRGVLRAELERANGRVHYHLRYRNLEGNVLQAHIHFAQRGVSGGIVLFLCSNLPDAPAGTPACPGTRSGEVSGLLTPEDITAGAKAQGIDLGETEKLGRALLARALYVNIHTDKFPAGELRAQLRVTER